jgi:ribosome-associated protein
MLDVDGKLQIPLDEFDLSFARSSGPGGQNVNKVNSKAVLYWTVGNSPSIPEGVRQRFLARYGKRLTTEGVLVISSDEFRDQKRNIDSCLEKVAAMLREVLTPPKPRKKTKPSRGSVERRLSGKKSQSDKKKGRGRVDY